MKLVVSLHDQTTELHYPAAMHECIDLLLGKQRGGPSPRPDHVISVQETGADRYSIGGDVRQRHADLSTAELLDALLDEVTHSLIDKLGTGIALHAAAVEWDGRSILIAGPTGAGKTSLAGWFIANGFEFVADELVTGGDGRIHGFPRPLLAKPASSELVAMLERTGRTVQTASSTVIRPNRPPADADRTRQAGLIIFPRYCAGSELELTALSPAMAGLKLMECNLNARNLADHGFPALTALARNVPALSLTYGGYRQLDGVTDTFAKFVLEGKIGVGGLQKLASAFHPQLPAIALDEPSAPPQSSSTSAVTAAIPAATPRKGRKKITIGMATYDDYDGVYFTLQALRLYHPEILPETELLVVDNHPEGASAQLLKNLENAIPNYRYVPKGERSGTAARDWIFAEASGDIVLCMDCHVFIVPGAVKRLIDYIDVQPDTKDLLQGPLLYDDLTTISTHFKPEWRAGMYGVWEKNGAAEDPDAAPFEIPMQGLGLFACRRAAWPGFNPRFRGFGGEEGYIHEKFRRAGGRTLCLPFLRWMHRFNRPLGTPYANRWEDRVRNYFIGFRELGLDTAPIAAHFTELLGETAASGLLDRVVADVPPPGEVGRFISDCQSILLRDRTPDALEKVRLRLEQLLPDPAFLSQHYGDGPAAGNRLVYNDAELGLQVRSHILAVPYAAAPHDHGRSWVILGQVAEHTDVSEWTRVENAADTERGELAVERTYRLAAGQTRIFREGAIHSIDCAPGCSFVRIRGTTVGA